jgi:endonuclease III
MTTPPLFAKYPTPDKLASATFEDVFALIKSISYPNSKANYLIDMAKKLVTDFKGEMPSEIDELIKLPGVGRKTASVIRAVYFNLPAMPVDTHVFRVSARIGLTTKAKTPLETEKQLVKHIPAHQLNIAHHWLILHGRYTCKAIKPLCATCGITAVCAYHISKGLPMASL